MKLILPQLFPLYVEQQLSLNFPETTSLIFKRGEFSLQEKIGGEERTLKVESALTWLPTRRSERPSGIYWGVLYQLLIDERPGFEPTGYFRIHHSPRGQSIELQTTNFQSAKITRGQEYAPEYGLQEYMFIDDVISRLADYSKIKIKSE